MLYFFFYKNKNTPNIQRHQFLKISPVKLNETTASARVPLKVSLCVSSESLTFTASAKSMKKSNQGMLAGVQNHIMSKERSLGFVGNQFNRGTMLSIISLIGSQINIIFYLLYTKRSFEASKACLVASY